MSDRIIFVHADWAGTPVLVGRLYARYRKNRQSASFEYDASWLKHASRFALEPALSLHEGAHHTPAGRFQFGSIGDSAPDRWGRMLMLRAERQRATAERRPPRSFGEADFLLGVNDETRMGALRFADRPGGPFLAVTGDGPRVPPLVELPRLLSAADRVAADQDDDDDLRLLLAPGSSLGGARPKASVRDRDGRLLIAKFPQAGDEVDLPAWEALTLQLARDAGINVATSRLESINGRSVLLLSRFDRDGERRVPFLSAMSLIGAADNEAHSYLEIAEGLRRHSGAPDQDLKELWRRIVFSVLVSNGDDHLRNHGLLLPDALGWRLSPAYDLNPTPVDIRPRVLSLAIDEQDSTASLELALSIAERLGIGAAAASSMAGTIGRAVSQWRQQAATLGLPSREIERMASAFEHADLQLALTFGV